MEPHRPKRRRKNATQKPDQTDAPTLLAAAGDSHAGREALRLGCAAAGDAPAERTLSPEQLAFIDFLVRRAVEEWERSTGK